MTPTPLDEATLSGRQLLLKREDLHELGAFKWRGALPALDRYAADGARAVVTASTGNHGAATAWAAERVGIDAIVYAPAKPSRHSATANARSRRSAASTSSRMPSW